MDEESSLLENWSWNFKEIRFAVKHESAKQKVRICVLSLVMASISAAYVAFFGRMLYRAR